MDDITSLQIRILSDQVSTAERRLRDLENQGGRTERSASSMERGFKGLMGTFAKLAAAVGGAALAVGAFKKIISTTREFQMLQASVTTAVGSVEKMNVAWKALVDFAAETPFSVKESVKSFINLINYGLQPSERALRSFGDTASAMSLTMEDMVETVAKATAGEFEPLRKFAITAKKDGDDIIFNFRGVKTRVKNEIDAIQNYFIELGENNFAGQMQKQMMTLNGAFSNLGDAWDQLAFRIGNAGVGEYVEQTVRWATEQLEEFMATINSGELSSIVDSQLTQFQRWWSGAGKFFSDVTAWMKGMAMEAGVSSSEWDAYWEDVFTKFPANVSYAVQRAGVEFGSLLLIGKEVGSNFVEIILIQLERLVAKFGNAISKMKAIANFDAGSFDLGAANAAADDKFNIQWEAASGVEDRLNGILETRREEIDKLDEKLDQSYRETDEKLAEALQKRQDWDAKQAADAAANEGVDAIAGVLPPRDAASDSAEPGGGGGSGKTKRPRSSGGGGGGGGGVSDFEKLVEQLQNEERAIEDSYTRRLELIMANTEAGSAAQTELSIALVDKWEEEQLALVEAKKRDQETYWEAMAEEERIIEESYERRRQIILESTATTEAEKRAMLEKAQQEYIQRINENNKQVNDKYLDSAAEFFDNLSKVGSTFGKKGFKIAQAAAIAGATIDMFRSAQGAYAAMSGIPYVGPALGAIAAGAALAAGAANIASIKSQTYQGAYETGGMISSGRFGLVGEAGPELVEGPAIVRSARTTADRGMAAAGKQVIVTVINNNGGKVTETRSSTADKEFVKIVIDEASKAVAANIRKGGTPEAKAIESTYGVGRGKRTA